MEDDQRKHNSKRQLSTQSEGDQLQQATKRPKAASDDLICIITHELPFDPVTAEDGRLYERAAIEQHILHCQNQGYPLKSPITNEPMGRRLISMPQIKSLIEILIENRSITGGLADAWKQKAEEKKRADRLLKKAQDGDAASMHHLYFNYRDGIKGFKKDGNLALQWIKKAHAAGSVCATARLGGILFTGVIGDMAVPKNISDGLILTSLAAQKGSDLAACNLGLAYANGNFGVSVDTAQAIVWLQKGLNDKDCPFKHMAAASRENCRKALEQLIENQGSD